MSWRGEQGEHFANSSVFSSRVLERDRGTVSLLPPLTPEARWGRATDSVRSARTTACETRRPLYLQLAPA